MLVRSAHSANIKERRDCSCALFDGDGAMVMQAEHIPVHLGAMPAAVRAIADARGDGDDRPWIVNDPYAGGTHLPDVTVVSPIVDGGSLLGFAASRAHHADVGGPTPGSMPADSTTLAEEGVVIAPRPLDEGAIAELTAQMRNPRQRRADLRAQLAANRVGATRLAELSRRVGADALRAATDGVQDYAERRMRTCIAALGDGERTASDVLEATEGDLALTLRATVHADGLTLDFTGSAAQHGGNLNCPLAVTVSACLFAVRVLTDPDIPASAGAARPLTVIAPEGSLLNARAPAAVVAGNVETSSRVADLVLAAFGRALGQGTMNNVVLGTDAFTYYETLGGGQGACADADGPSAVHVAMSNTLNTPVEALELEFPLRVTTYAIRRGSGGAGCASRRGRRRTRVRGAHRHGALPAHRAAPARAAGRRRRPAGGPWPQSARRGGTAAQGAPDAAGRTAPAARDARRRRARALASARLMAFPSQPPPLSGVIHTDVRVDRARWHVATAGDPDAPPMVLLHGWPQNWWMWRRLIAPLAAEHRLYIPDLRGFGWSDAPPGTYSKMGLAADIERLLDVLEIDRCVLVGHDWGGFLTWLTAIRAPDRLERAVVMSIIHPWWRLERSARAVASGFYQIPVVAPGINRLAQPRLPRLMARVATDSWNAEDIRLYGEQWRRPEHAAAAAALYRTFLTREMPALSRGKYANRRVTVPVLSLTGADDPVCGPARIRGAEPHCDDLRLEVVEGAGHFLPEDKPGRVVDLILGR